MALPTVTMTIVLTAATYTGTLASASTAFSGPKLQQLTDEVVRLANLDTPGARFTATRATIS